MDIIADYTPTKCDPLGKFEESLWFDAKKWIRQQYNINIRAQMQVEEDKYRKSSCPKCQGKLYRHGYRYYNILTLAGSVSTFAQKFRCQSCNLLIIPGAKLVPYKNVSSHLMQAICYLITQFSYKNVSVALKELFDLELSPMSIHRYVLAEHKQMQDRFKMLGKRMKIRGTQDLLENIDCIDLKNMILYIGIDGGHVKGWKECESHEIKCINFATGSKICTTYSNSKALRYELENRYGYASNDSIAQFSKTFKALAIARGALTASKIIIVSDGATWIKKLIKDTFEDAIHLLDIFHLKYKINKLFTYHSDIVTEKYRLKAIEAVDEFDPEKIYEYVGKYTAHTSGKAWQKSQLLNYIKENQHEILNHKKTQKHGSGMIEKAVDLLVSRRLKTRGMAWTKKGSSAIMPLKVMVYNGTWDLYWEKRKSEFDASDFVVAC